MGCSVCVCVCRNEWTACVSGFRIKVIVLIIVMQFKDLMFVAMSVAEDGSSEVWRLPG